MEMIIPYGAGTTHIYSSGKNAYTQKPRKLYITNSRIIATLLDKPLQRPIIDGIPEKLISLFCYEQNCYL